MKMPLLVAFALALSAAAPAAGSIPQGWTPAQVATLRHWAESADEDALPRPDLAPLDQALAGADPLAVSRAADAIALQLARMHLRGCASPAERVGWRITDEGDDLDLEAKLAGALAADRLDAFFTEARPSHSDYAALRTARAAEADPAKRAMLARNMERWRWMPHALGEQFVLVNAASFEVSLWQHGSRIATWPVIVGKPSTPTPVFAATITGVIFNPWWDIPPSIVRESVGALASRNPALARKRGYVWGGGRYRQRPGPSNSLGQMKLVMPNPYNVYLHDTPAKQLFTRPVRAFSHGCVRVGDALGFAATLAQAVKSRAEIDAIVASGRTTTVPLASHLPVYVTYFTASTNSAGALVIAPDVYGRDARMGNVGNANVPCSA